jgi:hypothetical protein
VTAARILTPARDATPEETPAGADSVLRLARCNGWTVRSRFSAAMVATRRMVEDGDSRREPGKPASRRLVVRDELVECVMAHGSKDGEVFAASWENGRLVSIRYSDLGVVRIGELRELLQGRSRAGMTPHDELSVLLMVTSTLHVTKIWAE